MAHDFRCVAAVRIVLAKFGRFFVLGMCLSAALQSSGVAWFQELLSFLLAIGLSWSHVWRRLTGQYSTDDID